MFCSTLELEFRTRQPSGLLLYMDDGGYSDFIELKLFSGQVASVRTVVPTHKSVTDATSFKLRLRFNLGSGAETVGLGRSLHSGHWHRVSVTLGPQVTLGLDTLSKSIKWVPHWFDIL